MGRRIIACAAEDGRFRLAGAVEAAGSSLLGADSGELAGIGPNGVKIGSRLEEVLAGADVVIDFSSPAMAPVSAGACAGAGKPLVVGTTGLNEDQEKALRTAAEKTAVVYASNMSVGVNLLFRLVREAARTLGEDYDIEIVEAHHRRKKDSPSGTARTLAETAAAARGVSLSEKAVYGRRGLVGERPRGEIGIHAVRAGDIVGEHTVYFSNSGERLELIHRAHTRDTLARGALRAAAFAAAAAPGLYTMEDVLF